MIRVHTQRVFALVMNYLLTWINARSELEEVPMGIVLLFRSLQYSVVRYYSIGITGWISPSGPFPASAIPDVNSTCVFRGYFHTLIIADLARNCHYEVAVMSPTSGPGTCRDSVPL